MSRTSEILHEAAARVRQGWAQRTMMSPDGHVCAAGAVLGLTEVTAGWRALEFPTERQVALQRLVQVLGLPLPTHALGLGLHFYMVTVQGNGHLQTVQKPLPKAVMDTIHDVDRVAAWNDAPLQTADNVATALEFAAVVCDVEEAPCEKAVVWVDREGVGCH